MFITFRNLNYVELKEFRWFHQEAVNQCTKLKIQLALYFEQIILELRTSLGPIYIKILPISFIENINEVTIKRIHNIEITLLYIKYILFYSNLVRMFISIN